jgi:hypothetical protein
VGATLFHGHINPYGQFVVADLPAASPRPPRAKILMAREGRGLLPTNREHHAKRMGEPSRDPVGAERLTGARHVDPSGEGPKVSERLLELLNDFADCLGLRVHTLLSSLLGVRY